MGGARGGYWVLPDDRRVRRWNGSNPTGRHGTSGWAARTWNRATCKPVASANKRRGFQVIKGSNWLERRDVGAREIEGGKLSHLIDRGIVDPADQDADVAHGLLLGQYGCPMLPQVWRGGFVLLI